MKKLLLASALLLFPTQAFAAYFLHVGWVQSANPDPRIIEKYELVIDGTTVGDMGLGTPCADGSGCFEYTHEVGELKPTTDLSVSVRATDEGGFTTMSNAIVVPAVLWDGPSAPTILFAEPAILP